MILAILQARMSSTRMPGKVMAPVLGEPMIWRQIERIRRSRHVSKVVVATTTETSDDALTAFLLGRGCSVHRGDVTDVLARYAVTARSCAPSHIVRLKADCPLTDPQVIDAAVTLALQSGAAYTSNCEVRTYPMGMDVEVIEAQALVAADREASLPEDRAHVTSYIRRFPLRFQQAQLTLKRDLSGHRWTVDRPEDFAFVREVYRRLYVETPDFGLAEVAELIESRPELAALAVQARKAAA
jgi:spore coat polysaccharide biosynthesis protein SpsF